MPNKVQVIGSFTNPPWSKVVDLNYCLLRHIFVMYLFNVQEGKYLIKFIVDGEYKCSKTLPIITDSAGQSNNLLEIVSDSDSSRRSVMRPLSGSISSSVYKGLTGGGRKNYMGHDLNFLEGRSNTSSQRDRLIEQYFI